MSTSCCGSNSPRGGPPPAGVPRRDFLKWSAAAAAGLAAGGAFAGPFVLDDFKKMIPLEKKLSPEWLKSLTERGGPETYTGADLQRIGMPAGGLFCGTVYLAGDGRLWLWDVFNRNQEGCVPKNANYGGRGLKARDGANYVEPPLAPDYRVLEQRFDLAVKTPQGETRRTLDATGFADVRFTGQYPIGIVEYADPALPVRVKLEAFSPFIPHDTAESSLPATVFSFDLINTGGAAADVELAGFLENAVLNDHRERPGRRVNAVKAGAGHTVLILTVEESAPDKPAREDILFEDWSRPEYGDAWTVEGTAFGRGPIDKSKIPDYQGDVGGDTPRVVNSHATAPGEGVGPKDNGTGRLVSRPFKIGRRFIAFWIGGGSHKGHTCLNLLVDGKVVRSATGRDNNAMGRERFDVSEFEGRDGAIEIVDDRQGPWGNVGVGRIVFTDKAADEGPMRDLPDYGSMALALLGPPAEASGGAGESPVAEKMVGWLARRLTLPAGGRATVNFVVAWHFPNLRLPGLKQNRRHYAARFGNADAVAAHVAGSFDRLAGATRLWRDTWYDSTLPWWLLNRTFANTSILATTTCHRFDDGRFWAWEGIGCCAGTCTHVWHYAQAPARIFPELERDHRERVDFGSSLAADGVIRYRGESGATYAVDGQAGRILGAYREHKMSVDDGFLRRVWPGVKKALSRIIRTDGDADGIVRGPLHNTLDADWYGVVPWLCGLYHAALRAGEEMATEMGDAEFARQCRAILDVAAKNLDDACWNGDFGYYVHKGDDAHAGEVGAYEGCHIDMVMGQGWAWQAGLGRVMTEDKVRASLQALWKYNFTPDVGPFRAGRPAGRWYAMPGDGGLIMVSFPFVPERKIGGRGAWSTMYFNECMSGFEHQAAAHMVWEGLLTEGLAVTRAIHDRYSGKLRNPYNEIECSDHYARAMASYGTFLAVCGFDSHGPRGRLAFAPKLTPDNFKAPFTAAGGWGSFSQKADGPGLRAEVAVKWGAVKVGRLDLNLPADRAVKAVKATVAGRDAKAAFKRSGSTVSVVLSEAVQLAAGQSLVVAVT